MIKISVPNDDHVALRAMAKALEEIAVARGAPAQSVSYPQFFKECASQVIDEAVRNGSLAKKPEVDTTSQQVESLAVPMGKSESPEEFLQRYNESETAHDSEQAPPTTDSTGTPWDERIHSASKALNADGTWRLRRKPKDMDEAEWNVYLRSVADELVSEPHGPDAGGNVEENKEISKEINSVTLAEDEPTVTPQGDDFHTDAGVVTEQQVASFPPPPPVPVPAVQAALEKGMERYGDAMSKLAENDGAPSLTFPQVMAFLTERHGRITSAQVDQIIADMGLEKITDLNTQPEHTGPFITRVKALLGE